MYFLLYNCIYFLTLTHNPLLENIGSFHLDTSFLMSSVTENLKLADSNILLKGLVESYTVALLKLKITKAMIVNNHKISIIG